MAEQGIAVGRRIGTHHATADSLDALALVVDAEAPSRAEALYHEVLDLRVEHGVLLAAWR